MIERAGDLLRRLVAALPGTIRRGVPLPARSPRRPRVPVRRDRRLWLVLPLLLVLAAGTVAWRAGSGPGSLDDAVLTGPRRTQGPVCLAIAGDTSGSMARLAGVRRTALRSLVQFARRSLYGDDLLEAVVFAQETDTDRRGVRLRNVAGR